MRQDVRERKRESRRKKGEGCRDVVAENANCGECGGKEKIE